MAEKEQMKEQTRQDVENHQEEKKNRNIQRTGTYRERYEGQMTEILSHINSIDFEIDTMRMSEKGLRRRKKRIEGLGKRENKENGEQAKKERREKNEKGKRKNGGMKKRKNKERRRRQRQTQREIDTERE